MNQAFIIPLGNLKEPKKKSVCVCVCIKAVQDALSLLIKSKEQKVESTVSYAWIQQAFKFHITGH